MAKREPEKLGTAGGAIASMGLLLVFTYFCALYWLVSFLYNSISFFWLFTISYGWQLVLAGGVIMAAGLVLLGISKLQMPKPEKPQTEPERKYPQFPMMPQDSMHEPVEA